MSKSNTTKAAFAHITIGIQLAITVLIFVYAGYRLDLYYNTTPIFLSIGTVLGMALGFYHLIKDLQSSSKKDAKDDDEEKKRKVRWM